MFEIDGDHIAQLSEEDLRELVGRLCEAELEKNGCAVSAVTRGGHQNAGDGGIDVRVSLPADTENGDFIPRPNTGFQVKRTDMPAGAIREEMRPFDTIRPVIDQLANQAGAYVIVSSLGSVADVSLNNRRTAMREAVADVANGAALQLDFYDRTRLATWARQYSGIIPWLRERIGKPLIGWQSFGAWCSGDDRVENEYLQEKTIRVKTARHEDGEGFSPSEALDRIRDILRIPQGVVRLVGLSGVGKTRFAQALFDKRVGKSSLDPSLAAYTNMADSPHPLPVTAASEHNVGKKRTVLVVDNCPSELHNRLSEVCRAPGSFVSLLTIEYDIREDEPEGTEVFALEPASLELIEQLVGKRRPDISSVDARTIAEFSGGNARIAFALVKTIELNGTVSGLKDEQLFQRLFQQRHNYDAGLLTGAEACSLVYSFNGEELSGERAELPLLGSLVSRSADELFRDVAELMQRDLVQKRGPWRAVLPHAIANRLAANALKKIAPSIIDSKLIGPASGRLRRSFSRRLSYLHECPEAVGIVTKWLSAGGALADVAQLDELTLAMFQNVAPVAPKLALAAIETSLEADAKGTSAANFANLTHVIRSIGYDGDLFARSVAALEKVYRISEEKSERIQEAITSLFHIYLSGTHATIDQRLEVIENLLRSEDEERQKLGGQALHAFLEASYFHADWGFEFGGRSRDYGYWARTDQEVRVWFARGLDVVERFALGDDALASKVRTIFATQFRGLWSRAGVYDEIERVALKISEISHWRDGWIAVRETRKFDAKDMEAVATQRLVALEQSLKPTDLAQKIRSMVIGGMGSHDFEDDTSDDIETSYARTEAVACYLGEEAAVQPELLTALLPELLTSQGRTPSFGQGLANAAPDQEELWADLVSVFSSLPNESRRASLLNGFIHKLRQNNSLLCDKLLDAAVDDERLIDLFPTLQAAAGVDSRGVERLRRSLLKGRTPVSSYHALAGGRAMEQVPPADLGALLEQINSRAEGNAVAIAILSLHLPATEQTDLPAEIVGIGRLLITNFVFSGEKNSMHDYWTARVVVACLRGTGGEVAARALLTNFLKAPTSIRRQYFDIVQAAIKVQSVVSLDCFLSGDVVTVEEGVRISQRMKNQRVNPFGSLRQVELIAWCSEEPAVRFPLAARIVQFAQEGGNEVATGWTDIALEMLRQAPNRSDVLAQFAARFVPSGWSGSLVPRLEAYGGLLDSLDRFGDDTFSAAITGQRARLVETIKQQRIFEDRLHRPRDESFE
ncbi:MAG: hypothetical protein ACT4O6_16715 [Reyranella sp.]